MANENKWGVGDYIFLACVAILAFGLAFWITYDKGYKAGADARDQNLIVKFKDPRNKDHTWIERKNIKDNEIYGIMENK